MKPKKNHLKSVMDSLSLYASTEEESVKVRAELAKFSRQPGELFPEAINRFDSLYCFLEQLKRPVAKQELALLSLNTLKCPYLLKPRAAKIYGNWLQELERTVNRENIIHTISKLECNDGL